jgi:hypothetical protein
MSFRYHIRFLFIQSVIKSPKKQGQYQSAKVNNENAKNTLLQTIGSKYRGKRYFGLVDRVYTRIEDGIIPIYDVQLYPDGVNSLDQLLDFYESLRKVDIRTGW